MAVYMFASVIIVFIAGYFVYLMTGEDFDTSE